MLRQAPPALLLAALLGGCADDVDLGDVNLFTIEDDKELGRQLHDEILADPETYPLLDEADYPDAYAHLYRIRDEVLDGGEVEHTDDFDWNVYLIDDDETLNAFAAPGGYLYFYTGLVRYLDHEDHFAGVMGHEMAHAALRHATEQLTKLYGVELLLEALLGEDPGLLADIAETLVALSFSRTDEAEADEASVRYLCPTMYAADGAAGFFEKLLAEGDDFEIPEFLSTHPSSDTRVEDIRATAEALGCDTTLADDAQWEEFLSSLP